MSTVDAVSWLAGIPIPCQGDKNSFRRNPSFTEKLTKNRSASTASLLGPALRSVRANQDLRQVDLVARTGMSEPTAVQCERGQGRLDSYVALAAALGMEISGRGLPSGPHIGNRLSTLRQRQKRSMRTLAAQANLSTATIAAVEQGAPGVRLAAVEAMARALGVALRLRPVGGKEDYWDGAAVSATHDGWTSPPELLEKLYPLVGGKFDLDPCSPVIGRRAPVKARNHYTLDQDGLTLGWSGTVFMNPPFKQAAAWVAKAKTEAATGRVSALIGLLPGRVDTAWWHDHVAREADIWFLRGRLHFGGSTNPAPFPCALVVWAGSDDLRQGLRSALPDAWWVGREPIAEAQ